MIMGRMKTTSSVLVLLRFLFSNKRPRPGIRFEPVTLFTISLFNATATTEIYTLSLHDALPIWWTAYPGVTAGPARHRPRDRTNRGDRCPGPSPIDRKSTRLNSSHLGISYA